MKTLIKKLFGNYHALTVLEIAVAMALAWGVEIAAGNAQFYLT